MMKTRNLAAASPMNKHKANKHKVNVAIATILVPGFDRVKATLYQNNDDTWLYAKPDDKTGTAAVELLDYASSVDACLTWETGLSEFEQKQLTGYLLTELGHANEATIASFNAVRKASALSRCLAFIRMRQPSLEEALFMNTETDKQPETAVRCISVVGDDERANKEWEEGPEWAFLLWCDKRGVWPRLTHQEVFLAGWEAARRS
jgi:hypothetical protein